MRALLLFLLCLAIPFQGVAAAYAVKTPCPMEQMGATMAMDAGDTEYDCCNDPVTFAKTGQMCKVGQECPTGGFGMLVAVVLTASPPLQALSLSFPPPYYPPANLASIWRPPALS